MHLGLRILIVSCLMLCVFAGNLWGFRAAILQHGDVTWQEVIDWYFTRALPAVNSAEWWYILGGLVGSWVGFGMLKRQNLVKYE